VIVYPSDVMDMLIRIVKGAPDDAELAALVVALTALARAEDAGPARVFRSPSWSRRSAFVAPGAWASTERRWAA
jgi:hypothetical protein